MTRQIVCDSINQGYQWLVEMLFAEGTRSMGRQQGAIFELRDVELILKNPRKSVLSLPSRNMSRKYASGEFCLYLAGTDKVEDFAFYSKVWKELADEGRINSAYGERMFSGKSGNRLFYAIDELIANPETKNAVVVMRDQRDQKKGLKDRCCTMFLQFTIRDGKLDMRTIMRSTDIWLGLPYDVFAFTRIMQIVLYHYNKAAETPVQLGTYTHQMLNVHAYPKQYSILAERFNRLPIDTSKAYEFPEFGKADQEEEIAFLSWEREYRTNTEMSMEEKAKNLRDSKFHPFFETLGSWLLNKVSNDLPTTKDVELMKLAEEEAKNSKCIDRQVGCVLTDEEGNVLGKGCNTVIHCNQNCHDKIKRICNVRHGEISALEQVKDKSKIKRAYVTLFPCLPCRSALTAAGVDEIYVKGFVHKGAAGDGVIHLFDPEYTEV